MIRFTRAQIHPIGIDVGHDSVKLLQLERQGDSLSVVAAARAALPPEARSNAVIEKRLMAEFYRDLYERAENEPGQAA